MAVITSRTIDAHSLIQLLGLIFIKIPSNLQCVPNISLVHNVLIVTSQSPCLACLQDPDWPTSATLMLPHTSHNTANIMANVKLFAAGDFFNDLAC